MTKLVFKAYKKLIKYLFLNIYNLKQKKRKSTNILVSHIENLFEEEKEKKLQYVREQYKQLLEDNYEKKFSRMQEIKTSWA